MTLKSIFTVRNCNVIYSQATVYNRTVKYSIKPNPKPKPFIQEIHSFIPTVEEIIQNKWAMKSLPERQIHQSLDLCLEESDSAPAEVLPVAVYIHSQHKGRLHLMLGVLLAAVTSLIPHKLLSPLLPILLWKLTHYCANEHSLWHDAVHSSAHQQVY